MPAVSLAAAELGGLCQGDSVPLRFAGGHCTRRGTGCDTVGRELLLKTTQVCLCTVWGLQHAGNGGAPCTPCPQGLTPLGPGHSLGTHCGVQPGLGPGALQRLSPGASAHLCQCPPPHAARTAPCAVGPIHTWALPEPAGYSCSHGTLPCAWHPARSTAEHAEREQSISLGGQ